jgi:WhiB family transcriptional regulator, redox-sensing transcriptional regulator
LPWYPEWTARAACRGKDPEIFFPKGNEADRLVARKVCWGCPVRAKCLRKNLLVPYGIFGGYTEMERYKMVYPDQASPHKRYGPSYFEDFYSVSPKQSKRQRGDSPSQEQLLAALSKKLRGN